jgi:5'-nucleotidase
LVRRLQAAVDTRYRLPAWTPASHASHKHADRLAAASEAFHVAGWSREAMRESLGITLEPLAEDPLPVPEGMRPWQPWPPNLAAHLFLTRMNQLQAAFAQGRVAERC